MGISTNVVQITDAAVSKMNDIVSKEGKDSTHGIRLGVNGGGCSGLSYLLEFSAPKEKDTVIKCEGFQLFIDPKSSIYLKGVVVDFEDGLQGKGFVFKNPNAKNTCGCGESFSV